MVDVPFAIGEELASKWDFLPYLERGITNYARLDVCVVGGLTEAVKIASMAEAHYIDLMPHNPLGPLCTAATVHLAAAIPNHSWLEIRESPTEHAGRYGRPWTGRGCGRIATATAVRLHSKDVPASPRRIDYELVAGVISAAGSYSLFRASAAWPWTLPGATRKPPC
jgi:hypothetical protein